MSPNASRGALFAATFGASALAALGVVLAWGFAVDDAWISARVAWRLANGFGYRFNGGGPPVDAVTPLGWALLLAPFAKGSVGDGLVAARFIGAVSWIAAAGWFGFRLRARGVNPWLVIPLLAMAPLGAWAGSGMETGLVLALSTMALGESLGAALASGVVAAWRPEMVPFCAVLALRAAFLRSTGPFRRAAPLAIVIALPLLVALIRGGAFGRALPLAAFAKPSDVQHGLKYAFGVLLFLGPTWLWIGGGYKALPLTERVIGAAVVTHLVAVVAAGGDWMPLWRLAVPTIPAALWVAAWLQVHQRPAFKTLRFGLASVVCVYVWVFVGFPGRHVYRARVQLVDEARAVLADARLVAALDVGWLGAAFPGDILDLAGVTDPRVALLPGGHTTKGIKNSWFDSTHPDTLVLLTAPGEPVREPWFSTRFARSIEDRIRVMPYFEACQRRGVIGLSHTEQSYLIVRCPEQP